MQLLGSMDSCAAGSASAAMQRKLASLSTADRNQFLQRISPCGAMGFFCFMLAYFIVDCYRLIY
ncbi:hypothetical protein RND71_028287 [Anisodus tanguticus]|uniref:Uncharacterized protein n=1 Tax=Anisodus tanguticus TaxID=243964 RepID=A0AAE1RI60_9SOLA|nr:hypothetical protein RND71_028287 [Anisodus tanguticus]